MAESKTPETDALLLAEVAKIKAIVDCEDSVMAVAMRAMVKNIATKAQDLETRLREAEERAPEDKHYYLGAMDVIRKLHDARPSSFDELGPLLNRIEESHKQRYFGNLPKEQDHA